MTWIDAIATCFSGEDDGDTKNKGSRKGRAATVAAAAPAGKKMWKQTSMQRLSFSDLSNPGSPRFAEDLSISLGSNICVFTTNELRSITNNYSSSYLLGEGGFGPVFKGFIDEKLRPGVLKPQTVAVKLLDLEGLQGHREWLVRGIRSQAYIYIYIYIYNSPLSLRPIRPLPLLQRHIRWMAHKAEEAEVIYLGQLKHPHVVKLIGYCCEDEQRLLVYEFMARGSLENHLFKRFSSSLPWAARLKIAVGAAKGLAFLHGLEKPIIYRDFKASNILLDSDFTAKLSDFGLAKDGPEGEETHVSTRVMGTHGYAAPEYVMTGHLTAKSDVYSFGVVLLELLTGLRAMDKKRQGRQQNLVEWTRPYLNDSRKLNKIMDVNLDGQYSVKAAQKAAAVAYQCLAHNPKDRPHMSTVVETLEPLQEMKDIAIAHFVYTVIQENGKGDEKDTKQAAKENGHSPRRRNGQHGHRNRSPISVIPHNNSPRPKHRSKEGTVKQ